MENKNWKTINNKIQLATNVFYNISRPKSTNIKRSPEEWINGWVWMVRIISYWSFENIYINYKTMFMFVNIYFYFITYGNLFLLFWSGVQFFLQNHFSTKSHILCVSEIRTKTYWKDTTFCGWGKDRIKMLNKILVINFQ